MPLRRPLPKLIVLEGQQVHMRGQNGAKGDVGGRTGRWVDVALDYEDGPRGTQVVAVLQRRVARVVGAVWPKLRGLAVLPQQLHPDEFRPAHILDEGGSQLADLAFLGDAHLHEVALPQLPHGNEDLALRQLRSRARLHRQLQGHAGVRRKHDAHPELGAIDHHPCRLVAVALVAVQTHPILVAAGDKHACTWLPRAQTQRVVPRLSTHCHEFLGDDAPDLLGLGDGNHRRWRRRQRVSIHGCMLAIVGGSPHLLC
mmetsp:Transcript_44694/g.130103  ORF Transcript_44694/g.130103 Transcript_44694/m.130103 type:complete len:256 (+) Transcript_44694:111-878(+)